MNVHKAGEFLGVLSVFLYGYTLPGVTLNLFFAGFVLILAEVAISLGKGPLLLQRNVLIARLLTLSIGGIGIRRLHFFFMALCYEVQRSLKYGDVRLADSRPAAVPARLL